MRSYYLIWLLILLSSCTLWPVTNDDPGPSAVLTLDPTPQQTGASELDAALSAVGESILAAANVRRALAGVPPLSAKPNLERMAIQRSVDMSDGGYIGHVNPQTGENAAERMLQQIGIQGQAAELLYYHGGALSMVADEVIAAWFKDADHKLVLLSPDFRYAGVGIMGDGRGWIVTALLTGNP